MLKWCIHVDEKGKALCEITYEHQKMYIPLELIKDFAKDLALWESELNSETE